MISEAISKMVRPRQFSHNLVNTFLKKTRQIPTPGLWSSKKLQSIEIYPAVCMIKNRFRPSKSAKNIKIFWHPITLGGPWSFFLYFFCTQISYFWMFFAFLSFVLYLFFILLVTLISRFTKMHVYEFVFFNKFLLCLYIFCFISLSIDNIAEMIYEFWSFNVLSLPF